VVGSDDDLTVAADSGGGVPLLVDTDLLSASDGSLTPLARRLLGEFTPFDEERRARVEGDTLVAEGGREGKRRNGVRGDVGLLSVLSSETVGTAKAQKEDKRPSHTRFKEA
jgi:hypothetical protein